MIAAFLSAGVTPIAARSDVACGRELWDLKTLSDPRRNLVHVRPVRTTVSAIAAKRAPRRASAVRTRGFERQVWRVTAQITEYKLEADSDIHMILFGDNAYADRAASSGT